MNVRYQHRNGNRRYARLRPRLPARYNVPWREPFDQAVSGALRPGIRVLDVGGGGEPAISIDRRPPGLYYVGLDLSAAELARAPAGAYDATVVGDVAVRRPELEDQFDLIVSWQVLEHVRPLAVAVANLRSYLRPEGLLVVQLSGAFSAFGLLNRILPQRLGIWGMSVLLGRDPETVFPAYYDGCWHRRLRRMFSGWTRAQIVPIYQGAVYFSFFAPLMAIYLVYEDWAARAHVDLATHYVIVARR